jgi:DNA replication initiation complex subunit (GINS family)
MENKEVVITYETLYEALRKEKTKQDLQKLDASFYMDVLEYLRDKQKTHDDNLSKNDIFSQSETEKTQMQMVNIKKLIKEIYDMRERKIINTALNKSRTKSNIIDTSTILPEEKTLFDSITTVLDQHRQNVLLKVQTLREPDVVRQVDSSKSIDIEQEMLKRSVKFLDKIEPFADEDLEMWGPYDKGDEAELPQKIAEVLVKQGKAVEI